MEVFGLIVNHHGFRIEYQKKILAVNALEFFASQLPFEWNSLGWATSACDVAE